MSDKIATMMHLWKPNWRIWTRNPEPSSFFGDLQAVPPLCERQNCHRSRKGANRIGGNEKELSGLLKISKRAGYSASLRGLRGVYKFWVRSRLSTSLLLEYQFEVVCQLVLPLLEEASYSAYLDF